MRSILNERNLNNKKVLLRLDLNVPFENGKISDSTRIDKILPTLKFLIQKKTKIIMQRQHQTKQLTSFNFSCNISFTSF